MWFTLALGAAVAVRVSLLPLAAGGPLRYAAKVECAA